jgi:hypothetical protein
MKPIAWIDKNTGKPRMDGFIQTDYDIPLYTHPAKTWQGLTAEEIATIPNDEFRLQKVEKILKERNTHPAKTLTDEEIMDESFKAGLAISKDTDVFLLEHDVEALVTFARAILRKAQEK